MLSHRTSASPNLGAARPARTVKPHNRTSALALSVEVVHADERASARIPVVEAEFVARAMAAATDLAGELHLRADDAVVIHNSNTLALRLLRVASSPE